jgi:hypothetical protein
MKDLPGTETPSSLGARAKEGVTDAVTPRRTTGLEPATTASNQLIIDDYPARAYEVLKLQQQHRTLHLSSTMFYRFSPADLPRGTMPNASERFWANVNKNGPLHPRLGTRCWIWTASRNKGGYGQIYANGRNISAPRFVYELELGPIPAGMLTDHRCNNRICVNPAHLRLVTRKQNAENKHGARSDSRTGVRGVSFNRYSGKYVVKVTHNGKTRQYGSYATLAEADIAARAKRAELFTHADGR